MDTGEFEVIKPGPVIKKYAEMYGCTVKEVVNWMQGYIDGPWHDDLVHSLEATAEEREAHIKEYVLSESKVWL
jgi:hypothetical protein